MARVAISRVTPSWEGSGSMRRQVLPKILRQLQSSAGGLGRLKVHLHHKLHLAGRFVQRRDSRKSGIAAHPPVSGDPEMIDIGRRERWVRVIQVRVV